MQVRGLHVDAQARDLRLDVGELFLRVGHGVFEHLRRVVGELGPNQAAIVLGGLDELPEMRMTTSQVDEVHRSVEQRLCALEFVQGIGRLPRLEELDALGGELSRSGFVRS